MITIQSALLVALGFLSATLLALLIAPAFWARAVRLTSLRIRESLPVTETEIRADKDRLRAEYAIRVHKLETQVEQGKLASARQTIDLSKRDTRIGELTTELQTAKQTLEEASNARRVLHATVSDRLPRVEQRLIEARRQLLSRDHEMAELAATAERQTKALAEAAAINQQQMAEIERLATTLSARSERNQDALADPRFDAEVALRAEIEALRAKTRDQSALISRMQSLMQPTLATTSAAVAASRSAALATSDADIADKPSSSAAAQVAVLGGGGALDEAGARALREAIAQAQASNATLEADMRSLRSTNDDQSGEISRLKAALAVYESANGDEKAVGKESRISLKAKLTSVQAQSSQQAETIQRLRTELAATNERLALQASHFRDELRRLGAGTLPTSATGRRPNIVPARLSLAERVSESRTPRTATANSPATADPQRGAVVRMPTARDGEGTRPSPASTAAASVPEADAPAIGPTSNAVPVSDKAAQVESSPAPGNGRKAAAIGRQSAAASASVEAEAVRPEAVPAKPAVARSQRPRLLDRISNLAKSP